MSGSGPQANLGFWGRVGWEGGRKTTKKRDSEGVVVCLSLTSFTAFNALFFVWPISNLPDEHDNMSNIPHIYPNCP